LIFTLVYCSHRKRYFLYVEGRFDKKVSVAAAMVLCTFNPQRFTQPLTCDEVYEGINCKQYDSIDVHFDVDHLKYAFGYSDIRKIFEKKGVDFERKWDIDSTYIASDKLKRLQSAYLPKFISGYEPLNLTKKNTRKYSSGTFDVQLVSTEAAKFLQIILQSKIKKNPIALVHTPGNENKTPIGSSGSSNNKRSLTLNEDSCQQERASKQKRKEKAMSSSNIKDQIKDWFSKLHYQDPEMAEKLGHELAEDFGVKTRIEEELLDAIGPRDFKKLHDEVKKSKEGSTTFYKDHRIASIEDHTKNNVFYENNKQE